jgi:Na+-translocating ferredoxin:NAD+ oxidoreductase RnfG subunit
MKVLIACEESQTIAKAFRARGHEAFSADIQLCGGVVRNGTFTAT